MRKRKLFQLSVLGSLVRDVGTKLCVVFFGLFCVLLCVVIKGKKPASRKLQPKIFSFKWLCLLRPYLLLIFIPKFSLSFISLRFYKKDSRSHLNLNRFWIVLYLLYISKFERDVKTLKMIIHDFEWAITSSVSSRV